MNRTGLYNAATWLRKEYGLDVARVLLGHSSPVVTEVYAEIDRDEVTRQRQLFDPVGHYSRPDVFTLNVDTRRKQPVVFD